MGLPHLDGKVTLRVIIIYLVFVVGGIRQGVVPLPFLL